LRSVHLSLTWLATAFLCSGYPTQIFGKESLGIRRSTQERGNGKATQAAAIYQGYDIPAKTPWS
jgi:hypothetical protein